MKNKRCLIAMNWFTITFLLLILFTCKDNSKNKTEQIVDQILTEEQLYRPNFHFTPKANWMNDPNGMFYLNGKYHLYFQYYPEDNVWGPMHWGHASSEDLVTWKEYPIALYPDSLGYIFSGSAVVDTNNTSGFGKDGKAPVVAIFTYHDPEGEKEGNIDFQSQAIAYSLDEGQTWTKYSGNPVIPNPKIKDFRDPKVIWDEDRQQWIMVLATYEKTLLYVSKNLKEWNFLSDFGEGIGAHDGVWECPDFFPLKVEGSDETKWVLLQSLNPGHINGGSGTQYFIGDFDGTHFLLDKELEKQLKIDEAIWLDYGRDNYAGVTWSNIPKSDGRKLFIGWMSNWDYAKEVPTYAWRSSMTIARELKLRKMNNSYILFSNPIKELNHFKTKVFEKNSLSFKSEMTIVDSNQIDINKSVIEIELSNLNHNTYTFSLENSKGDLLEFGINNIEKYFFIDRTKSGDLSFSEKFANVVSKAHFKNQFENLHIEMVIDKTSLELFFNNGETVMTEIFFPRKPMSSLKISTENESETTINKLVVSQLKFNN
ncbi:glycoside hydrolase family 32 protein [Yeosuana sp. MJ-SS3]|uniref:Glycoside hydrolase family 32 protein n=1 Tax=Gilvirhabdus luticola TaxID=3079858 RepID=A0ABU3U4K7_9FLAO|nr:glycoside hydrolase family 32 protein [Yeosuana sp. MJ-SS3]MDU8885045.1 glycoside hydrolase family 32 protein [Yeosuana sp. MJ-SS3]